MNHGRTTVELTPDFSAIQPPMTDQSDLRKQAAAFVAEFTYKLFSQLEFTLSHDSRRSGPVEFSVELAAISVLNAMHSWSIDDAVRIAHELLTDVNAHGRAHHMDRDGGAS